MLLGGMKMTKIFKCFKLQKTICFLLFFPCFSAICFQAVFAKSAVNDNQKLYQASSMIDGLFDFIRNSNKNTYEEHQEKIIKVYFHNENAIRPMSLENYIAGVLYAEVPSYYDSDALKAQAIAARSYTLYKINNGIVHQNGADVCTDYNHCQAWTSYEDYDDYPQSIKDAVEDTKNIICTYNGKCINAMYFSNSGGATESIENVWSGSDFPYLKSVYSPGESEYYDYCQVKLYTHQDFLEAIKNYSDDAVLDNQTALGNIKNIKRSPSGRIICAEIGENTFTGLQIRAMFSLRSSNIYFAENSDSVSIVSLGYGHGVGMSQCGAQAMAKNGSTYEEILKHYYTGIELESISQDFF